MWPCQVMQLCTAVGTSNRRKGRRTNGALLPVAAGELVADLRDADGPHLHDKSGRGCQPFANSWLPLIRAAACTELAASGQQGTIVVLSGAGTCGTLGVA